MDVDHRVIRFDSLSKVLSAGMRLGFMTTLNADFTQRIMYSIQASNMHTSGVSQALCLKYLDHIGMDGFKKQLDNTAYFYGTQRDKMAAIAERVLAGKCKWDIPGAGMFYWFQCTQDTTELIRDKAREAKVLLLPGSVFDPGNATNSGELS